MIVLPIGNAPVYKKHDKYITKRIFWYDDIPEQVIYPETHEFIEMLMLTGMTQTEAVDQLNKG